VEFIIAIVVITAFCVILGISMDAVIIAAAVFGVIVTILMLLFFTVSMLALVFSKKKKAFFLKIDKPSGSKFKSAFYMIGDREYPCFFPSEFKMMYKEGRKCSVFLNEKVGKVFDVFSVITCIVGFIFSLTVFVAEIRILLLFKEMI
jgi:hypothetical protein